MERPVRKIFPPFQFVKQVEENQRYLKAVEDYDKWTELENEKKKLENEALKLENEEKRALIEAMRKQQNIGGSNNMYDRIKPDEQPKKEHWLVKLFKS